MNGGGAVVGAAPVTTAVHNMVNGKDDVIKSDTDVITTMNDVIILDDEDHASDSVTTKNGNPDCVENGDSNGIVNFTKGLNFDQVKHIVKAAVNNMEVDKADKTTSKEEKGNLFEKLDDVIKSELVDKSSDEAKTEPETKDTELSSESNNLVSEDSKDSEKVDSKKDEKSESTEDKSGVTSSDAVTSSQESDDVVMLDIEKSEATSKQSRESKDCRGDAVVEVSESQNSDVVITNCETIKRNVEKAESMNDISVLDITDDIEPKKEKSNVTNDDSVLEITDSQDSPTKENSNSGNDDSVLEITEDGKVKENSNSLGDNSVLEIRDEKESDAKDDDGDVTMTDDQTVAKTEEQTTDSSKQPKKEVSVDSNGADKIETDLDKPSEADKAEDSKSAALDTKTETAATKCGNDDQEMKEDKDQKMKDDDEEKRREDEAEDQLLRDDDDDDNENLLASSRPSSVASVKSDILLADSPVNSPRRRKTELIVVESQSRKRPMSQSSVGSDEASVKKSRVAGFVASLSPDEASRMSDTDTKDEAEPDDGSDAGEVLTVLNDEMLHALVKQKLDDLLSKEMDQVVAPLRKRISELQNLNQLWRDKVVNLQKQINDMDLVKQRTEHKRGVANKPAMRTVAVQVCTTIRSVPVKQPPPAQVKQPTPPPKPPAPAQPPTTKPMVIYNTKLSTPTSVPNITSVRLTPVQGAAIRTSLAQAHSQAHQVQIQAQAQAQQGQIQMQAQQSPPVVNTSLGQSGIQTFVLSPPQSSAASPLIHGLRRSTVREMLSNRTTTAAPSPQNLPVSSIMSSVNKPATIQLPSGNRVVIDLTSDEEKNKLAGLVQGVVQGVVPSSVAQLQTSATNSLPGAQTPILLTGGSNMPMILQTLAAGGNAGNVLQLAGASQALGQNSQNVMTLVQTPQGLVQKGSTASGSTVLTTPLSVQPRVPMGRPPLTVSRPAVPVSLQRGPSTPSSPNPGLLGTIRVRVPAGAVSVPATAPPRTMTTITSVTALAQQPQHPAPLPPHPVTVSALVSAKKEPPRPTLKISRVAQGIVLSWNMAIGGIHEEITNYQLYAYQEGSAPPSTALWKRVGDVKALPLPMACTLTQFQEGNKYHFAVRAVDKCSRVGVFSEPASIYLAPSKD